MDGKVFPVNKMQSGTTAPPFHPWCRGTTAPYYEDVVGVGQRFARDADGKTYTVPSDMTYAEWKKKQNPINTDKTIFTENISLKRVEKSIKDDIINVGSDGVVEFKSLGKIDVQPLEAEFGKLRTDEIIVTDERLEHIKIRHPEDFELFEKYGADAVTSPDVILKDQKNQGTVFMVKKLEETNLNVIVRLVLETDDEKYKNSVMTFYRIRQKNLDKLEKKNKVLYKKV